MGAVHLLRLTLVAGCALIACSPGAAPTTKPGSGPPPPPNAGGSPASASTSSPTGSGSAAQSEQGRGGAAPAAVPPAAKVRITDIQITSAAGSYIAAEKGYFKEEGIEVEWVPSAADQVPVLVADEADVAGAPLTAFLFNAFGRGIPLKIVADHGANVQGASAGGIVIRKDLMDSGAYQGPGSLRGWKIATASQGSNSDITLDTYLRSAGLTFADIDRINLSYPDMLPALANKAIDGAYYQEPFTTIAVEQGFAARGPAAWQIRLNQQVGVVLLSERLLKDRTLSLRYVRAYTRGVRDYVKGLIERDPAKFDEVVPILIEHTSVKDRAMFEKAVPSGLRGDPIPNVESITEAQDWFLANGVQTQRVNVPDMLDLTLVQQAIDQLGPYR